MDVRPHKSIASLLSDMARTGFQGRRLGEALDVLTDMVIDKDLTILMGYAGSLSVAGQWTIINWLIENRYIDILVSTGANISEDIVDAMGFSYYQGNCNTNDEELFRSGINRYYDILGRESDYMEMTERIAEFILTLDSGYLYTSREFLYRLGLWLHAKGIRSVIATAAIHGVPVYCPAIADSPFGDAALIAHSRGFTLTIDAMRDYIEFMGLSRDVKETGVIYIGGGVPKDFIQLFAAASNLLYEDRMVPTRQAAQSRLGTDETYYPHRYALQITTDSPQWGGLSGCTFEEAVSWGKETVSGRTIQCYCDATIALPLLAHGLAERVETSRQGTDFSHLFRP